MNPVKQIAVSATLHGMPLLFALDEWGYVWQYSVSTQQWRQLPPVPDPEHPTFEAKADDAE